MDIILLLGCPWEKTVLKYIAVWVAVAAMGLEISESI